MPVSVYASPSQKIAAEFRERFGDEQVQTIRIKPLYTKEITAFIKRAEAAHQAAAESRLVFKQGRPNDRRFQSSLTSINYF